MTEAWLPLALATALTLGFSQVAAKRGTNVFGPRRMAAAVAFGEAAFFALAYGVSGAPPLVWSPAAASALVTGAVGMAGLLVYFEALARGTVSRIGTMAAAYPAVTVVLALVLLQEVLSPLQAMGIAFLIGSATLLGYRESADAGPAGRTTAALVLVVFMLSGIWGLLVKITVDELGPARTFAFFALAAILVGGLRLLLPSVLPESTSLPHRDLVWPAVTILAGGMGIILVTLAFSLGPASLVAPVTGAYPVVIVLVARPILRESVGPWEAVAVLCFLAGLFAVSLP